MKNISITAAFSLLTIVLCSCGGGGDTGTVDCSSSTSLVQTSTVKIVASATVAAIPSSVSSYSIMGTNLDNVSGIQLDIAYDSSSLMGTPAVTQGALVSGGMFVANTSQPGLIKIAVITPSSFSGSGQIAAISFASKTGNGGITSITTSMINSQGSIVAVSPETLANNGISVPSSIPSGSTSATQQQSSTTTSTSSTACR